MRQSQTIIIVMLSLMLFPFSTTGQKAAKSSNSLLKINSEKKLTIAIYDLINKTSQIQHETTSLRLTREISYDLKRIKGLIPLDPYHLPEKKVLKSKQKREPKNYYNVSEIRPDKLDATSVHFLITGGNKLSAKQKKQVIEASGGANLVIFGQFKLLADGDLEFDVQGMISPQGVSTKSLKIREKPDRIHVVAHQIAFWAMAQLRKTQPDKKLKEEIETGNETNYAAYMTWREMENSIKRNDLDRAILQCNEVLSLDPNYHAAYEKLGMIYERQKAFDMAFYYYNRFLSAGQKNGKKTEMKQRYSRLIRRYSLSDKYSSASPSLNTHLTDINNDSSPESLADHHYHLGLKKLKLGNHVEAKENLIKAMAICLETKYHTRLALVYEALALIHSQSNDLINAQSAYEKAVEIYESMDDRLKASKLYNKLGYYAAKQRKIEMALAFFGMSLDFWLRAGHKPGVIQTYLDMGKSYEELDNHPMAQTFYQKGLEECRKSGDLSGIALFHHYLSGVTDGKARHDLDDSYLKDLTAIESYKQSKKLSNLYYQMGLYYFAKKMPSKAFQYIHKVIIMNEKLGHKAIGKAIYNNLGLLYMGDEDYDNALIYLNKALNISSREGNKLTMSTQYNNIASIHFKRKSYKEALKGFKKSLELKTAIGDTIGRSTAYYNLALLSKEMGNKAEALSYIKKAADIEMRYGCPSYKATISLLKKLKG